MACLSPVWTLNPLYKQGGGRGEGDIMANTVHSVHRRIQCIRTHCKFQAGGWWVCVSYGYRSYSKVAVMAISLYVCGRVVWMLWVVGRDKGGIRAKATMKLLHLRHNRSLNPPLPFPSSSSVSKC